MLKLSSISLASSYESFPKNLSNPPKDPNLPAFCSFWSQVAQILYDLNIMYDSYYIFMCIDNIFQRVL